jgi:hypothetical protein
MYGCITSNLKARTADQMQRKRGGSVPKNDEINMEFGVTKPMLWRSDRHFRKCHISRMAIHINLPAEWKNT